MVLLTIVVVSGVFGVILYTLVPPRLVNVDSNLTISEMSTEMNQMERAMARLASGKSDAFQAICKGLLQAQRPRSLAGWRLLFSRPWHGGGGTPTDKAPQANQEKVEPQERPDLIQLYLLAGQMREMHARLMQKQRYRNIWEFWLYLHLPLSFALLLAVMAHVIAALYYSRWGTKLWAIF